MSKTVTKITFWHKVNFNLQSKFIFLMTLYNDGVEMYTICDSNVIINFLNLHLSRDLKHVEHEVI